MTRKLRPLRLQDLDRLPTGCGACVFWESSGERERRCCAVQDEELQRAWFRHVTDDWGECGRVAYEDEEVLGFIKYAPSTYFPQAFTFPSAPSDPSVPLIGCLHIAEDARHRGLGTVLLRAALKDLVTRGERRVEAFGFLEQPVPLGDMPMFGAPFLLRNGFTVAHPDPLYPLLRLDLRTLVVWQDNLEAVLDSLRFPLRVPNHAPVTWTDPRSG